MPTKAISRPGGAVKFPAGREPMSRKFIASVGRSSSGPRMTKGRTVSSAARKPDFPARTLARVKEFRAAGDLKSAARLLGPLMKAKSITPKSKRVISSFASQLYRSARNSVRRRDLRKARFLLRLLSRLGPRYATQAQRLKKQIETAAATKPKPAGARMGRGPGMPTSKRLPAARRIVSDLKTEGERIGAAIQTLEGGKSGRGPGRPAGSGRKRRTMSAAARKRISEMMKLRGARVKKAAKKYAKKNGGGARAAKKKAARHARPVVKSAAKAAIKRVPKPRKKDPSAKSFAAAPVLLSGDLVGMELMRVGAPTGSAGGPARRGRLPVTSKPEPLRTRGSGRERATEGAGKPSATRDLIVNRTPHMDFSINEPFAPGTRFDVIIFADQQQARSEEKSEGIIISAPPNIQKFSLHVKLLTSAHFEILGQPPPAPRSEESNIAVSTPKIIITRGTPESTRATFPLRVLQAVELPQTQPTITALFQYKGRPSGKVTRKPAIQGLQVVAPARRTITEGNAQTFSDNIRPPGADPPAALQTQYDARTADVTISILEGAEKDGRHFSIIVDAPGFSKHWEGPWILGKRTEDIVAGAMENITGQDLDDPAARISALRSAGIEMFKATPPEVQQLFWRILDSGTWPRSMLVVSEEPYIPWEIMVPWRRKTNGTSETRDALGIRIAIGRWVTDKYLSPPQKIAISQTYIVAPQYPPNMQLKNAPAEVKLVQDTFSPASVISPALVKNIDSTLALGGTTLLHFICHGKSGFPQAIALEHDKQKLSCWQLEALDGFVKSFSQTHTFVFLNACEVGRLIPALVGIGGFGNAFVGIGSSGVIAPLWSVDDHVAHQVADLFYKAVGTAPAVPFAHILRIIRERAYQGQAEDTWAAYCFYGDPLASCV